MVKWIGLILAVLTLASSVPQTPIVGEPEVSVVQAQKWAQSRGAHQRFIHIAPTYWYYGRLTGIRPEVLYAQSAKETAFGRYGGVVDPSFNNWAGIKIEEGGSCYDPDAHERFATPEDGARAHFNHMCAYVGFEPIGEPHGRYHTVMTTSWAGTIEYAEELGGKWAPSSTYGESIVNDYLEELLVAPTPGITTSRIYGDDRYQTAVEISEAMYQDGGAESVVLARGDDFPDALAGVPLAYQQKGPLLLTPPENLHEKTAAEIERVLSRNQGTIYILGGNAAISDTVYDELARKYDVIRLGEENRYKTAVKIAKEYFKHTDESFPVFLVTGDNYPDAAAISSAAAKKEGVILLTDPKTLDLETELFLLEHLGNHRIKRVYAIGGIEAISRDVYLQSQASKRIAGEDRWETSRLIAEELFCHPTSLTVATGMDFPDALTGGKYAAFVNAPVLLTHPKSMPNSIKSYLEKELYYQEVVYFLGGKNAVDEEVLQELQRLLQ